MTYDYECKSCGIFTVERGMKEPALTECPNCKAPVKRIYKPSGAIVKCDGFFGKSE